MLISDLSLEQRFELQKLKNAATKLSLQEAQSIIGDLLELSMRKDNVIRALVKEALKASVPTIES